MKENLILDKSKAFALRIIKLYNYLRDEKREFVISKQIVRSGMSIGANAKEAALAQSKPAFVAKMNIWQKQAKQNIGLNFFMRVDILIRQRLIAYTKITKSC